MRIARKVALFALGGGAYVGLELLWRRRSHISMFAAGGLCFLLLGKLRQHFRFRTVRAVIGACIITAVEFGTGLLVNRNYRVWDYRCQWGNIQGQICPFFMVLWIPVSLLAMELYGWADRAMAGMMRRDAA